MARRFVRLALLLVVQASACTLVISQEMRSVRCADEGHVGPPACNSQEFCALGRCRVCLPREVCGDLLDNDCNGSLDDTCELEGDIEPSEDGGSGGRVSGEPSQGFAPEAEAGSTGSGGRPFWGG